MNKSLLQTILICFTALSISATAEAKTPQKSPPALKKHHSSSSSDCCKELKSELQEIEKHFACDKVHEISKVPYTVLKSGKYCVKKDLTYTGSGAAITVAASNVTINLANHNLTLTNPAAQGFLIEGVSEVTIENDAIAYSSLSTTPTGIAVNIIDSSHVLLDNLDIKNAYIGVHSDDSSDVTVKNSHIREATASHINTLNTGGLTVERCSMYNTLENLTVSGNFFEATDNIRYTNVKLFNSDVFYRSGDSSLFENLTSIIDDVTYIFSAFQLGSGADQPGGPFNVTNTIVIDSTFLVRNADPSSEGIQVTQGHGILLENLTVDGHAAGATDGSYTYGGVDVTTGAKLAIGENLNSFPPSYVYDVKVVNCVFSSADPSAFGITIAVDPTEAPTPNAGVVIEDCVVDNCSVAGIYVINSIDCAIKNNEVHRSVSVDTGDGIVLDTGAIHNKVLENNVMDNYGTGIYITGPTAIQNHINGNRVFGNHGYGIDNEGFETETYFNTSCNNSGTDCVNVFPTQAPGANPAFAGSNICCTTSP